MKIPQSSTYFHFTIMQSCVNILFMMQECPRCKFSQPKDRYCANCGLDIETYVPQPESVVQKLGKNTALHIAIVILIMVGLGVVIYVTQKERLAMHLLSTPNKVTDFRVQKNSDDLSNEQQDQQADESEPDNASAPAAGGATSAMPQSGSAADTATTAATGVLSELIFTFAEAPKTLLQQLATEGQTLSETAQAHAFAVPAISDISQFKEKDPDFRLLPGGMATALKQGVPFTIDFTELDIQSNHELGINLDWMPHAIRLRTVDLEVDGQLSLLKPLSPSQISSQTIHANFSFASTNTLVMILILPRQNLSEDQMEQFSNTPLVIYESPQFQSGSSELAIFIQSK